MYPHNHSRGTSRGSFLMCFCPSSTSWLARGRVDIRSVQPVMLSTSQHSSFSLCQFYSLASSYCVFFFHSYSESDYLSVVCQMLKKKDAREHLHRVKERGSE